MKFHHAAVVAGSEANADRFYQGILRLKKLKASFLKRDLAKSLFDVDLECPFILYGNTHMAIEVFITKRFQGKLIPLQHVCLKVENKETFLNICNAHDISITRVPKGDLEVTFIQDYDGNRFEIK
jgi:catechol 2,3-dioxygenase-like lactoylglutathione lyase family enzyme